MWVQPLPALWELPLTLMVVWESTRSIYKSVMLSLSLYCALYDKSNWGITFLRPDTPILHQIYENIHYTLVKIVDYEKYIQGGPKKNRISSQKPAWKAWCCESCLTSLPLPTGPYLTLYSNIIVSTSPIDMNENMKRNHKDIEWKQLFFEIPVFFGPPCSWYLKLDINHNIQCYYRLENSNI